jgi:ESS family glutamate:Na+ symporter
MKLGSWVSFAFNRMNLNPPVYMGGMLLAILYRNLTDQGERFRVRPETVHTIASISLGLFLAMAMASLNLLDLKTLAIPMLAILGAQIVLMLLFAVGVTYVVMGRDYDAAIMAAGHVGFGLGITPNTVATMDALEEKFGPSPRAILIITLVGAFLIDITNFIIITAHLKYLHH